MLPRISRSFVSSYLEIVADEEIQRRIYQLRRRFSLLSQGKIAFCNLYTTLSHFELSVTDLSDDLERIRLDKEILGGEPVVKGTRIPVYMILELLAAGMSEEEIIKEYPTLKREDIRACLAYASKIVREEEIIPLGA